MLRALHLFDRRMRAMINLLRWLAVAVIIVGWYVLGLDEDSPGWRIVLLVGAFATSYVLILWRPPKDGIFRERSRSARARKVFVAAEPCHRDPFVLRRRYRVRKPVHGRPETTIKEGQLLCYIGRACQSYDRVTSFNFLDDQGETVFWALRDNEPVAAWREIFDEVDDSRNQQHV